MKTSNRETLFSSTTAMATTNDDCVWHGCYNDWDRTTSTLWGDDDDDEKLEQSERYTKIMDIQKWHTHTHIPCWSKKPVRRVAFCAQRFFLLRQTMNWTSVHRVHNSGTSVSIGSNGIFLFHVVICRVSMVFPIHGKSVVIEVVFCYI